MSNGELLYLSLVITMFFLFIVAVAYGISATKQARKAREACALQNQTASVSHTPALRKAA